MLSYVLQREKSEFSFYFNNEADKEKPFAMMFLTRTGRYI
jgi:hypothetical protein